MEPRKKLELWQTGFIVMLFTSFFEHTKAIDPAHARNGILFHILVIIVSVIGFIFVGRMKSKLPADSAAQPAGSALSPDEPAIGVTYESTREANWRCNTYVMSHHWQAVLIYACFALLFAAVFTPKVSATINTTPYATFPVLFSLGYMGWTAFFRAMLVSDMKKRFPSPSTVRICTTTLTPRGIHDHTPDKVSLLEWGRVKSVRLHDGDFYVLASLGRGHFIPRSAFRDEKAARQFYEAAMTLWKCNGAVWPDKPVGSR